MLLLVLFTFPGIFAAENVFKRNGYDITIENNTLINVQATQRSSNSLNLSSFHLKCIDKNAFKNLNSVEFLNLANNSLAGLPQSVFSKLKNLKNLSLANNNIKDLNRAFVGLDKLTSLDISNNPVKSFKHGQLYGLSPSVEIITRGNSMQKIISALYDNIAPHDLSDDDNDRFLCAKRNDHNNDDSINNDFFVVDVCEKGVEKPAWGSDILENPTFRVKVCIVQGRLMLLENMHDGEVLPNTCREVKHDDCCSLYIDNLGIETFEKGWYQVNYDLSIRTITLTDNNITRITKEMLNDLPPSVRTIDLSRNRIEQLESGIIINYNIRFLYINDNLIGDIEDGTFDNMRLWRLIMNGNWLTNSKFIVNLPRTLKKLCINRNQITELPNFPASGSYQLSGLYMRNNYITIMRKNALRGLSVLLKFDLSNNQITTLERGCFKGLRNMYYLSLRGNNIANLDGGVFSGLNHLRKLDLGRNKLTKISPAFRDSLPNHLEMMHLDNNLMKTLEPGSFVNVPKQYLNLKNNSISSIAKGSFVVPDRYGSDLEHDAPDFSEVLGPLFAGNYLATLLAGDTPLPKPQTGIGFVDLSKNPIRRLENGALYGITKGPQIGVFLAESPIEYIQGGLFDDV